MEEDIEVLEIDEELMVVDIFGQQDVDIEM